MIDYLKHLDQQLLLFINGLHTPWLDTAMFQISKIKIFLPFFILWGIALFKLLKIKRFIVFAFCLPLLILLTDQSANFAKNNVARYRPTHNTEIGHKVHTVNEYRGGQYGYYSGHAANTFGIATFLFLIFYREKTWLKYSFFPFAILASYSRMYLGVHYPFDILTGTLTGIIYGYLIFKIFEGVTQKMEGEKQI